MTPLLFIAMPGNEAMTRSLAHMLGREVGQVELRTFPDGETYLRFVSDLTGRALVLVCTLDHPNSKILPLFLPPRPRGKSVPPKSVSSRPIWPICVKIGGLIPGKP